MSGIFLTLDRSPYGLFGQMNQCDARSFSMETYLHVVVASGRARRMTFVLCRMSLCSFVLFLSGPRNMDGQGLQYDSHALGV